MRATTWRGVALCGSGGGGGLPSARTRRVGDVSGVHGGVVAVERLRVNPLQEGPLQLLHLHTHTHTRTHARTHAHTHTNDRAGRGPSPRRLHRTPPRPRPCAATSPPLTLSLAVRPAGPPGPAVPAIRVGRHSPPPGALHLDSGPHSAPSLSRLPGHATAPGRRRRRAGSRPGGGCAGRGGVLVPLCRAQDGRLCAGGAGLVDVVGDDPACGAWRRRYCL